MSRGLCLRFASSLPLPLVLLAVAAPLGGCLDDDLGNIATPPGTTSGTPDMALPVRALTVLYTNDEHSHLLASGPEHDDFPAATTAGSGKLQGGVTRRKVILDRERAAARAAGADTVTLSAGDNAMGTLTQVAFATAGPDYAVMKQLGYDATTFGNHEFDLGPKALAASITAAMANGGAPQIVSSNLRFSASDPADDSLAALFGEGTDTKAVKRYHVLTTASGIKVGLVGILGANAASLAPAMAPVLASGDAKDGSDSTKVLPKIYADVQPLVDHLRTVDKCDVVIALSHGGADMGGLTEDFDIARNVAGLDVVVSGHSHTILPKPVEVKSAKGNRTVLVVQAGAYGQYLGRLPLVLDAFGTVRYDVAAAVLLPVDDTVVPDPTIAKALEPILAGVESTKIFGAQSFLERTLSEITGKPVTDDASTVGDLFFYPLGGIGYDALGLTAANGSTPYETNVLNLVTDAMRAVGAATTPEPVDVSLMAAGVIRANLNQGKSGALTFNDLFRVLPLGGSPDGTPGYPLVSGWVPLWEIRGAMEFAASRGLDNGDFFIVASGMRVTVDTNRPPIDFSNAGTLFDTTGTLGRIVKIEWDSTRTVGRDVYDTVLYDAANAGAVDWFANFHVIMDIYLASFAGSIGATINDKDFTPVDPATLIIKHADGKADWKDYEALAWYVKQLSDANGGKLPSRYDATSPEGMVPRRVPCSGPKCQHL